MKYFKLMILLLSMCLLASCDLILDTDLEKEKIVLISPGENEQNDSETQFFFWEENEDIDAYRLQIASPSFNSPSNFFFDTLTDQNSYTTKLKQLKPFSYQWRVRGENSVENKSPYTTRSLQVDTLKDIRDKTVELSLPAEGHEYLEDETIKLSWKNVDFATKYIVSVRPITPGGTGGFESDIIGTSWNFPTGKLQQFSDNDKDIELIIEYEWDVVAFISQDNQTKQGEKRVFKWKAKKETSN